MANKRFLMAILVMALVFGMAVIGCDSNDEPATNDESDTWTNVTSLSQLDGTWKGSYTSTEDHPGFNGITCKVVVERTYTINASAGTYSYSTNVTRTYSGDNIASVWPVIKQQIINNGSITSFFNDSDYTVTITEPPFLNRPVSSSFYSGTQINQKGDKWKWPGSGEYPDIIYTKQ